jgi:hypothetical protein
MLASRLSLVLLAAAPALLMAGGGTTTVLTTSANPAAYGASLTLTATTHPAIPGGNFTVTFYDGATSLGVVGVTVGGGQIGTSTLATSLLTLGSHTLTAHFGGGNYEPSTSAPLTQLIEYATTTTLTSSGTPSTFGQSVVLTATVAPSSATGKATFYDGSRVLGIGTLASGVATLTTELIGPGSRSLAAYYQGDANDLPSLSVPLPQTTTSLAGNGFASQATYSVGTGPQNAALGDFNGDGRADVVTADYGGTVSVRFGNSDGTFGALATFTAGTEPDFVAVGDFNGDGVQDLAVADYSGGVNILIGNSNGTFNTLVPYVAGSVPTSVATGDFNGDGFVDLAVTSASGVSILLGNGDGTFNPAVTYAAGSSPVYVVVGDFNEDGIVDLAVASGSGVSILTGVGDGTFNVAVSHTAGSNPGAIAIGDFNQDGHLDLAVEDNSLANVSVLNGDGLGGFGTAATYTTGGAGIWVAVADFNGDGWEDLATVSSFGTTVSVLLNDGTGLFLTNADYSVGSGPFAVVAGDFNGDGVADLIAANSNDNNLSVLLGTPAAPPTTTTLTSSLNPSIFGQSVTFTATVSSTTVTGTVTFKDGATTLGSMSPTLGVATYTTSALTATTHSITAVYGGDVNNGPSTSTAVSQVVNAQTVTTTVLTSSVNPSTYGTSTTLTATVSPSSATGSVQFFDGATSLGTGSLSSGVATLALSSLAVGANSLTAVYGGDVPDAGSTSPGITQTVNQITSSGILTTSLTPATYGHTVTLTMTVVPSSATGKVTFYDGPTVLGVSSLASGAASLATTLLPSGLQSLKAYYAGDTNDTAVLSTALSQTINAVTSGGFDPVAEYEAGSGSYKVAVGDFNGDGHQDLAIPNPNDNTISVLLGAGDGTFQTAVTYLTGAKPLFVVAGDFNGDGFTDLAVTNNNNGNVSILLGKGDGTFYAQVLYTAGSGPLGIAMGDFNGDGFEDLAVTNTNDNNVSILLGKGDGTFYAAVTYAAGTAPVSVAVGDFNRDGHTDLAVVDQSASVSVLLGNGDGTFQSLVSYSVGSIPRDIAVGDFNGDGYADLAVTNPSQNGVNILLGKGDGTFNAAVNYSGIENAAFVVAADFDGDGNQDLAVSSFISNNVSVLTGIGDGTFAAPVGYGAGGATAGIAVGDFNGDGRADLAFADLMIDSVGILLGALPTTTTEISSANPSTYGSTASLTITVTPSSATGTVEILQGVTVLASGTLTGGTATLSMSAIPAGAYTLTVVYLGDATHGASTSSSFSQTINQASTTTSLTSSANPSTYGENATFTITVLPSTATGTYQVMEGATVLGSGSLIGGVATFSISSLPVGSYTGTIVYSGDSNYTTSTSASFTQVVNPAPTTTSLMSSLNPSTFAQSVTFTATVSPSSATGMVTFMDGATSLGTGSLSAGVATLPAASLTVGTHSITAVYGTDGNNSSSTSTALSQVVNKASSSTTVTSSLNPSTYGQSVTFTAHITGLILTGMVTFLDGSTSIGTGTISEPGSPQMTLPHSIHPEGPEGATATLTLSTLTAGVHSITAVYAGDANHLASTSPVLLQTVNQGATSITLTSAPNPSVYGQPTTLTVTISPATATGTITFKDGSTTLGTGTLSGGVATFSLSVPAGVHILSALYGGDANDLSSISSTLSQTINPANATVTLTSSVNPASFGQTVDLVATVSPSAATGTITFKDGSTTLVLAILGNGTATAAIQILTPGVHALTAVYSGDANDTSGTGALSLTVNSCAAINTTSIFLDSAGGPQVVTVTASSPTCPWGASTASPWIQLSESGGTGSGAFTATLSQNTTGVVRTGTILVGQQTIAVTERVTTQIFADVPPSNPFFDAADLLYTLNITTGCSSNPLDYCPDQNIPRWEMAAYIVRAIYGGNNFPYSNVPLFNDVPVGANGFAYIQKMAELGITSGCGNGDFCPLEAVARDQMAIFVIRMRYGATALFDFPSTPYFTDVNSSTFGWSWIQRLKEDSVTNGCTVTTFCPTDPVTRGEMAVFIVGGGFNALLPPATPVISSISPATIVRGAGGTYTVTGLNTSFVDGVTTIAPIPGITVGAVTVSSATSLTVQLTAASDAIPQPVSVLAITGNPPANQEAVLPNSLVIQ